MTYCFGNTCVLTCPYLPVTAPLFLKYLLETLFFFQKWQHSPDTTRAGKIFLYYTDNPPLIEGKAKRFSKYSSNTENFNQCIVSSM